jgi:hypothetical protein
MCDARTGDTPTLLSLFELSNNEWGLGELETKSKLQLRHGARSRSHTSCGLDRVAGSAGARQGGTRRSHTSCKGDQRQALVEEGDHIRPAGGRSKSKGRERQKATTYFLQAVNSRPDICSKARWKMVITYILRAAQSRIKLSGKPWQRKRSHTSCGQSKVEGR